MPATPAWPPKSAPRLFVDQQLGEGTQVPVEGNQAHYLTKVMRVAPGDAVVLCDDRRASGRQRSSRRTGGTLPSRWSGGFVRARTCPISGSAPPC